MTQCLCEKHWFGTFEVWHHIFEIGIDETDAILKAENLQVDVLHQPVGMIPISFAKNNHISFLYFAQTLGTGVHECFVLMLIQAGIMQAALPRMNSLLLKHLFAFLSHRLEGIISEK